MSTSIVKIRSRAGLIYEGTLHSIDEKHSTVTLKRVRLCNNLRSVRVNWKCQNFDYVIFRGGDIEDVQISLANGEECLFFKDSAIVDIQNYDGEETIINNYDKRMEHTNQLKFNCPPQIGNKINSKYDPGIVHYSYLNKSPSYSNMTIPRISKSDKSTETSCNNIITNITNKFNNKSNYENLKTINFKENHWDKNENHDDKNEIRSQKAKSLERNVRSIREFRRLGSRHQSLERITKSQNSDEPITNVCPAGDIKSESDENKTHDNNIEIPPVYDRRRSFYDLLPRPSRRENQSVQTNSLDSTNGNTWPRRNSYNFTTFNGYRNKIFKKPNTYTNYFGKNSNNSHTRYINTPKNYINSSIGTEISPLVSSSSITSTTTNYQYTNSQYNSLRFNLFNKPYFYSNHALGP